MKTSPKRVVWLIGQEGGIVSSVNSAVAAGSSNRKSVKPEKKFKTRMKATPFFIES